MTARAKAIGRSSDDLRRGALAGTPGEIVDKIGRFAALGATRVYLWYSTWTTSTIWP